MGGGSSFVFGKASFIIKEAPPWDALVTWMVIRESCVQAGTKLNPHSKSPLCSEGRLIPKGACHVLMSPLLTLLRAGMISWGIRRGACPAINPEVSSLGAECAQKLQCLVLGQFLHHFCHFLHLQILTVSKHFSAFLFCLHIFS